MKEYIIAGLLVFFAEACQSNEWIPVGKQAVLTETNTLEVKLWEFLSSKRKVSFKEKKSYRFQYKYIDESTIFINAICIGIPESGSESGAFPGPTTEELKKDIYQVMDGGSCFFNVKYNIDSGAFTSLYVNGRA
jgi:hypothetical protein